MKDLASNYLAEKREAEEDYLDNQELSLDEVFTHFFPNKSVQTRNKIFSLSLLYQP
jgi:hypothetical protein